MVTMTASVDAAKVDAFNNALNEYAASLGDAMATAPRRAAIQMCKSFVAATTKAPKFARKPEYAVAKSDADPKHRYITAKDGRKLRRWTVDRIVRGVKFDAYAANRRELRQSRLRLGRAGLAKKSWGWVMHSIFNDAAPDTPWQRRKRDVRNPKDATRESTSSVKRGLNSIGGFARICNRIDYVGLALKCNVDEVATKAANWMLKMAQLKRMRTIH